MKQAIRPLTSDTAGTSFLAIVRANRNKVVVLAAVAVALIGVEVFGYFRDAERPLSVEWLFKPPAG